MRVSLQSSLIRPILRDFAKVGIGRSLLISFAGYFKIIIFRIDAVAVTR